MMLWESNMRISLQKKTTKITKVERLGAVSDHRLNCYFNAQIKPISIKWNGNTYANISEGTTTNEYYVHIRSYPEPSKGDELILNY